ncbi:MAG: DUF4190 domain-containing protein [Planctomycetota bacterium]
MPERSTTNTMGLVGFILAVVGFFSGGCLSLVGLIFSLIGLGKEPRGFAIAGLIISIVSLLGWIILVAIFGLAGLAAIVGLAALASETSADFDTIVERAAERYAEVGAYPGSLDELGLPAEVLTNQSGEPYQYTPLATGYELRDPGPDGSMNTSDDAVLTRTRNPDGSVTERFESPFFEYSDTEPAETTP